METVNNTHKTIDFFNPVISTNPDDWRDYLHTFDVGDYNFTTYLGKAFLEDCNDGTCATYVILNESNGHEGHVTDIVGYFSLSTGSIPYYSEDYDEDMEKFTRQLWGTRAIEIKMFAINKKYQDVFYEIEGCNKPIAAWCLLFIIRYSNYLIEKVVGFQAIFLHSTPTAVEFYKRNGFKEIEETMHPFVDIDSEFAPLWMPLKKISSFVFEKKDKT